ncbi:hypothetical protein UF75_4720 [Desulfosporosinus sp. I2]|nr:hypothetical protein UF75_4720 [Desulfosporosinus sp. I2]
MHLYRGGMPLALLSEWLGHAQLETTMIYAYACAPFSPVPSPIHLA